jgi:hypothetical protein
MHKRLKVRINPPGLVVPVERRGKHVAFSERMGATVLKEVAYIDNYVSVEGASQARGISRIRNTVRIHEDFNAAIRSPDARHAYAEAVSVAEVIGLVVNDEALEHAAPIHFDSTAPDHDFTSRERARNRSPMTLLLFAREVRSSEHCYTIIQVKLEDRTSPNLGKSPALRLRSQAKVP